MREIRTSGSEGGGAKTIAIHLTASFIFFGSSCPYDLAKGFNRMELAVSSRVFTP